MQINTNLQELKGSYLFTEIAVRTQAYQRTHPEARVLRLGIGDVTLPLPQVIIDAMHKAVDELACADTFRGYGPEVGYRWLRQAIIDHDYTPRGIALNPDEVFVSDGAGSDLGNLSDLFDTGNTVAVLSPSYPAYIDTSRMAGREIIPLPCTVENGFVPDLPKQRVDIIYLCLPNNPTGMVLKKAELQRWVDYAIENKSIIIFDAAYEAYITEDDVPHSIYELDGAKQVAIEVRSFSKSAGFTAVRCGYTIVPQETGLQTMWTRRQCTKFNGASYISQRAAEATYTPAGKRGLEANLAFYKQTAQIIAGGLTALGYEVYSGDNAPYIWCKTPNGMGSWAFFDLLLQQCQIVCTPGVGFGDTGEGFVRFSAFSNRKDVEEALLRLGSLNIKQSTLYMCGIVGYIGKKKAYPILIKGLHRLEYRGYDSAGVALINGQGCLNVYKAKGKVSELEAFCADKDTEGCIGIAHTRWATHGEPNTVNAHPHYSESERLAIIHNGIIENYAVLKAGLMEQGYTFKSDTDTEVLVQLVEYTQVNRHVDLKTAVQLALQQVIGAYAIAILDKDHPDTLIAARKGSPLVVGIGEDEYFLASDATPIVEYTDKVIYIEDEEVVTIQMKNEKLKIPHLQ